VEGTMSGGFKNLFERMLETEDEPQEQNIPHRTDVNYQCHDCGRDLIRIGEWYMVNRDIWAAAVRGEDPHMLLCIGCLEKRFGRKLRPDDFSDFADAPINYWTDDEYAGWSGRGRSERLKSRMEID